MEHIYELVRINMELLFGFFFKVQHLEKNRIKMNLQRGIDGDTDIACLANL